MEGEGFTTDDFDSDTSSTSDTDVLESDSSPEHALSSRVPALALGNTQSSQHAGQRRPAVPSVPLPQAKSAGSSMPAQQPASVPRLTLQADQAVSRSDAEVTETIPVETAEVSGRDHQELYAADNSAKRGQQTAMFSVQLASEAFSIHSEQLQTDRYSNMSQTQAVKQFCASELGLKFSALKFFELREVQSLAECSDGCSTLAIAVEGSEFSLQAYENMLKEKIRLSTENQAYKSSLAKVRDVVDKDSSKLAESQRMIRQMTSELHDKAARCKQLERELLIQRQWLQKADASRLAGQSTLDQLKADFDKLSADVSRTPFLDPSSTPRRSGSITSAMSGSPISRKLSRSSSCFMDDETANKVFDVLEKLGDRAILSRLERVLGIVNTAGDATSNQ